MFTLIRSSVLNKFQKEKQERDRIEENKALQKHNITRIENLESQLAQCQAALAQERLRRNKLVGEQVNTIISDLLRKYYSPPAPSGQYLIMAGSGYQQVRPY